MQSRQERPASLELPSAKFWKWGWAVWVGLARGVEEFGPEVGSREGFWVTGWGVPWGRSFCSMQEKFKKEEEE